MLRFPNPCRSFDASKSRVCFWGYDRAIEVSFFIETDALKLLCPEMNDMESGFLQTFDAERERIHVMANKVYERGSNGSYSHFLSAEDVQG
jgi:hypothetical protein